MANAASKAGRNLIKNVELDPDLSSSRWDGSIVRDEPAADDGSGADEQVPIRHVS